MLLHICYLLTLGVVQQIYGSSNGGRKYRSLGKVSYDENSFRCPGEGFHADARDCQTFYRCVDYNSNEFFRNYNTQLTAFRFECGEGTVFDPDYNVCNHPEETRRSECGGRKSGKNSNSKYPSPEGANQYPGSGQTTSYPQNPSLMSNGPQLPYNPDSFYGQLNENENQIIPRGNPESNQTPLGPSDDCQVPGFHPVKGDCQKFVRCVDNGNGGYTKVEFSCGPGTVWDPVGSVCNYPTAVSGCEDQNLHNLEESQGGYPGSGGNQEQGGYPGPGGKPAQSGYPGSGSRPEQGEYPRPGDRPGQGGYPRPGGKPGQSGYPGSGNRPEQSGYPGSGSRPEQGEYPRPGDRPGQGGYPRPGGKPGQSGYPGTGNRPEQGGYPRPGGKPGQSEYPGSGNRPEQGEYPRPGGKPEQSGYPGSGNRPEQSGYPGSGNRPEQGEYPRPGDRPGQGGYPRPGGKPGQSEYPGSGNRPEQGEYPRPGGKPEQSGYPGSGNRPEQSGYPGSGNRPEQGEYPRPGDRPGQGGYPRPGSKPGQSGYPGPGGKPEQSGYPGSGGRPEQGGYPQPGDEFGPGNHQEPEGYPISGGRPIKGGSSSQEEKEPWQYPGSEMRPEGSEYPDEENKPGQGWKPEQEMSSGGIFTGQCTGSGFFGVPENCKKFIRCVENENGAYTKYEFECGAGTAWDTTLNTCNFAYNVKGCEGSEPNQGAVPEQSESQGMPTQEGYPRPGGTPSQGGYHQPTGYPNTEENNWSSSPENENSENTNPPPGNPAECQNEGFQPVKGSCRHFFRCVSNGNNGYLRYDFQCGEGTVWNQENQICDYPWAVVRNDVDCSTILSNQTLTQTTSSPSSTMSQTQTTSFYYNSTSTKSQSQFSTTLSSQSQTTTSTQTSSQEFQTTTSQQTTQSSTHFPTTKTMEPQTQPTTVGPEMSSEGTDASKPPPGSSPCDKNQFSSQIKCEKAGFFSDPGDCKKFYRCVDWDDGKEQRFSVYYFECGKGTIWDPALESCNHEKSVYPPRDCGKPNGISESKNPDQTTEENVFSTTTTKPLTMTTTTTSQTTTQTSDSSKSTLMPTSETMSTEATAMTTSSSDKTESTTRLTDEPTSVTESTTSTFTDQTKPFSSTDSKTTTDRSSESSTKSTTSLQTQGPTESSTSGQTESTAKASESTESLTSLQTESTTVGSEPTESSSLSQTDSTTGGSEPTESSTFSQTKPTTTESEPTGSSTVSQIESTTESLQPMESTQGSTTEGSVTTEPSAGGDPNCPTLTKDQSAFVCPTGFRRHPKDCNLFYQCTMSKETGDVNVMILSCKNDTMYDERKIQCLPPEETDACQNKESNRRFYRRAEDKLLSSVVYVSAYKKLCPSEGSFPYEGDCSRFYKCKKDKYGNIQGYLYQCQENYSFYATSKRCEKSSKMPKCNRSIPEVTLKNFKWMKSKVPIEYTNLGAF